MARDEFVDLYEVLELPVEADADKLRQRINELYLDAQRNLDHRNVQKRLRYQQLYELYLPQARHLLLDSERRAEYDQYLAAYRTRQAGGNVAAVKAPLTAPAEPESMDGELTAPAPPKTVSAKKVVRREEEEDPVKLAAEREQLWSKWKGSLERAFAEEGTIPDDGDAPLATSEASTSHSPRLSAQAPPAPVVRTQPIARTQPAEPTRAATARPMTPSAPPVTARPAPITYAEPDAEYSPFAQLHEQERLDLIRSGIESAGIIRGFTVGIVLFLAGCVVIFGLDSWLSGAKQYPFGLTRPTFTIFSLCTVTVVSLWCGWVASRAARRQASADLSCLSREELLRRNRR